MNESGHAFGVRAVRAIPVRGARVLEVGARDVNGSVRREVERLGAASYTGVDIEPGPGVDVVMRAEDLVERFGPDAFDLVVCMEVMEHVIDWRAVLRNLRGVLRPDGYLLLTTRSRGFPYHAYPHDFWRWSMNDLRAALADFELVFARHDPLTPGVFVLGRRTGDPAPDLSGIAIYSMPAGRRVTDYDVAALAALQPDRAPAPPGPARIPLVPRAVLRTANRVLFRGLAARNRLLDAIEARRAGPRRAGRSSS